VPKPTDHKPSSLAVNTDRAFINCLLDHGALSRASIATMTGISKPTVSESTQRLLARQVITECKAKDTQSAKRPSILYELNKQRGGSLAIALDDVSTQFCLWDLQGNERLTRYLPYPKNRKATTYINDLLNAITMLIQESGLPVLAIGLSIADPIHPKDGSVIKMPNSPFPVAQEIDFIKQLVDVFQCSVVIDNDVNWATLSEQKTTQMDNFIYVFLGRGIGCGLFFEHSLIRGHNGMAGEIGYVTLSNGKNLLEDIYKDSFINNVFKKPPQIEKQHLNSIAEAIRIISQVTHPKTLVLGGQLITQPTFYHALTQILSEALPATNIKISQAPDNASIVGAADGAYKLALLSLGLIDDQCRSQFGFHTIQSRSEQEAIYATGSN
jgi:predicted NBD/HSP70 family sugar kinase